MESVEQILPPTFWRPAAPDALRRWAIRVMASIVTVLGCVVMYGWIAHIPLLTQVQPGWPSMKFNTALCFTLFGIGALGLDFERRRFTLACACVIAVIVVLTEVEYVFDVSLRVDRLIVEPFLVEPGVPPGRMSPITAGLFFLAATALALLVRRSASMRGTIVGILASLIVGVALSALIGHITKTPTAYAWGAVTSVAVLTAVAFLLVGLMLGGFAVQLHGEPLPPWLPLAALISGLACTTALGLALFAEMGLKSHSLVPELTMAIGTLLSVLMAVSLQSRRQIAAQRDLVWEALQRREEALLSSARANELVSGILDAAPDAMIVAEGDGRITLLNGMAERMFGYTRAELIGRHVEELIPQPLRDRHAAHRAAFARAPAARLMGTNNDLLGLRKDGTQFPVDISLNSLSRPGGTLVITAIRDTTSRRIAEQRLRDSLYEKELLLKEVHHRVKNNLQVVASMLALQGQKAGSEDASQMFEACRQRVMSMALVHERLYGTSDLHRMDLGALVHDIATMLVGAGPGVAIETRFDLEPISVDVGTAIPASLIVNELITNALKHAFGGRLRGVLEISVRRSSPGRVRVEVADDGRGEMTLESFQGSLTLGATIVRSLVRQLNGTLEIVSGPGTRVAITFAVPESSEA